ncbi:MAG: peptidoglycan-binding protein, partial [Gemmatimonadetes bacterium RIFCSPLOWO2_12_FULL_68_9]
MAITKARFERLGKTSSDAKFVDVSFNPNELTYNKGVQLAEIAIPGLDSPILQFVRGQAETLTVDLFFDSTDEGGMGTAAFPVTKHTDQFYQLIKIDKATHAPPICRFVWGDGLPSSNIIGASSTQAHGTFQCVVESVRQKFSLFSPEGVPLRATLSLSLKEYKTLEDQVNEIGKESADHTHAHVVQRGDTLT